MTVSSPVFDWLLGAFLFGLCLGYGNTAHCQRRLSPETRVVLAQALVAEAQVSQRDWAAILHVLERRAKRAGWPLLKMTRRYCAAWARPTPRGLRMRRLGPSDRRYNRAHRFVQSWARGWVADPCRGRAWHWAAPSHPPRGRMVRVNCGQTDNAYYGLAKKH